MPRAFMIVMWAPQSSPQRSGRNSLSAFSSFKTVRQGVLVMGILRGLHVARYKNYDMFL